MLYFVLHCGILYITLQLRLATIVLYHDVLEVDTATARHRRAARPRADIHLGHAVVTAKKCFTYPQVGTLKKTLGTSRESPNQLENHMIII